MRTTHPIISFTGMMTAGKTSASKALRQWLGPQINGGGTPPWNLFSFADALRDMLRPIGLTDWHFNEGKTVPIDWLDGKTPRQLMQSLGTEWGRGMVHPEIWVRLARSRLEAAAKSNVPVINDDCRFDNEAQVIHALGGTVIEVRRPGLSRAEHASERGVSPDLIDAYIDNDGDLALLAQRVRKLCITF